jgi:hypothetical protein
VHDPQRAQRTAKPFAALRVARLPIVLGTQRRSGVGSVYDALHEAA